MADETTPTPHSVLSQILGSVGSAGGYAVISGFCFFLLHNEVQRSIDDRKLFSDTITAIRTDMAKQQDAMKEITQSLKDLTVEVRLSKGDKHQ